METPPILQRRRGNMFRHACQSLLNVRLLQKDDAWT
jgi:hypothetical protein